MLFSAHDPYRRRNQKPSKAKSTLPRERALTTRGLPGYPSLYPRHFIANVIVNLRHWGVEYLNPPPGRTNYCESLGQFLL